MAIGKFLAYLKHKHPAGKKLAVKPISCTESEWRQLCEYADHMAEYARAIMGHQVWPR